MRLDFLFSGLTAKRVFDTESAGELPDIMEGGTEFIYDLIKSLKLPLRTRMQRKALYPEKYGELPADSFAPSMYQFVGRQDLGFFTCHHIWNWTPLQIDEAIGGFFTIKDHKYKDYLSEDKLRQYINFIIEEEIPYLLTG